MIETTGRLGAGRSHGAARGIASPFATPAIKHVPAKGSFSGGEDESLHQAVTNDDSHHCSNGPATVAFQQSR